MVDRVGVIEKSLLTAANELIDMALAKAGGNPTSRENAQRWVEEKRNIQRDQRLLKLAFAFCDTHGYQRPFLCQIALRFPGERVDETMQWHLDKRHFDRLLGVYLNSNLEFDSGNFVVALGSEKLFTEEPLQGLIGKYEEIGIEPTQITATEGEVISVHRLLCHGTAPNVKTDYTRRVVWFRLHKHKSKNSETTLPPTPSLTQTTKQKKSTTRRCEQNIE